MKDEAKIREIVRDEMKKNYRFGDPEVAPHSHTGNDGLKISPLNILGIQAVPSSDKKYLNTATGLPEYGFASSAILAGGDISNPAQFIDNPEVNYLTQIPVIQGSGVGVTSAFEGGYAPDGAMVLFANGNTLSTLNIRLNGEWYQFVVDSVI